MPETFKEHCRKRLKRNVEHLLKYLNGDYPDFLIANQMVLVIEAAVGYCGEYLGIRFLELLTSAIRQRSAYCQYCDGGVNTAQSHPPVCEQCDARLEKAADEIDKELGDVGEDGH